MIAAGGRGERTGSTTLKQFAPIGGKPMYRWSVDLFLFSNCDPVILAVPAEQVDETRRELTAEEKVLVVEGGPTRQASVANGLSHVERARVVVHDAARPLATTRMVVEVLAELTDNDAAIIAVPVGDTVKRVAGSRVVATVPRSDLWTAQTPQAFNTAELKKAHDRAKAEDYVGSDDAALIERYGGSVAVVPGSSFNLKVTFPGDLLLAEAVIRVS